MPMAAGRASHSQVFEEEASRSIICKSSLCFRPLLFHSEIHFLFILYRARISFLGVKLELVTEINTRIL